MTMQVDLSIVMPCWKRPLGTRRMISDIFNQTAVGWELNLVGDCCDDFQELIDDEIFQGQCVYQERLGNKVNYVNLERHGGGFGYAAINKSIELASRTYTIWVANDDRLSPLHFQNYYTGIANTSFDIVMFETVIKGQAIREPVLAGAIQGLVIPKSSSKLTF